LAAAVHCSPYHLSRSFRAQTGYTLHGYHTQLRLRIALDRLADGATELADLSLELGFCSQSHFTNAFRASFGIPPGQAGRQLKLGGQAAMRNFLQDLPTAPQ
jgi:AraC-like DNA-binding protein